MTDVEELSCREFVELVTDYDEGALSDDERRRFEAHFAECTGCDRYLSQMRATVALTGELRWDDLAPETEQALRQAFQAWKSAR
jgi:anti-sigma factor RsiW